MVTTFFYFFFRLRERLRKTKWRAKEECTEYIQGIGNFKLKPMTLELSSTLRKRATVGQNRDGSPKIDENELTFLMIDACVLEPKIKKEDFKKLPIGVATKIVNAVNKISGIGDDSPSKDF